MFSASNIDLLAVGLAAAGIGILGFTIFLQNTKNATNVAFFHFSLASIVWSIVNFAQYHIQDINMSFWMLRAVIFIAMWHSFTLFRLLYIFPGEKAKFPDWCRFGLFPLVGITAILTLTPLVFKGVNLVENGKIATVTNGPALPLFGLVILFLVIGGIVMFIRKTILAKGESRRQHFFVLTGVMLSMALIITFNFILPAFFSQTQFIPYAGFFLWIFGVAIAFAVKAGLFKIKVAATALLIFSLCVAVFFEIAYTNDPGLIYQKVLELILIIAVGILLVRSVFNEVEAREEVSTLAKRLANSNMELEKSNAQLKILDQRKSEFVSLVSHQLRAPITAIKGYSSMLLEDSYGTLSEILKKPVENIFLSSQRLVEMVAEFLDISKIEQGAMTFTLTSVDIAAMLRDLVGEFVPIGQKKGLLIECQFPENEKFLATADEGKIRQVFSNLIDNSIKYTPKGWVHVLLERDPAGGKIFARIKDSGIGLSLEDLDHIFGKFSRGTEGQKENIAGSGLGLYVAKKMVEAQKGKIWVESEGQGKGSTFVVELPVGA